MENLVERYKKNKNIRLVSRHENENKYSSKKIKSIGKSHSGFHIKIWVDEDIEEDDIICSPAQEFLLYDTLKWVPAIELEVGDKILASVDKSVSVTQIEIEDDPVDVFALEIDEHRTYYVGRNAVLAHNLEDKDVATLSMAFGKGALAGGAIGATGSFLSPLCWICGVVVGGCANVAAEYFFGDNIRSFEIGFDYARRIEYALFQKKIKLAPKKPKFAFNSEGIPVELDEDGSDEVS
ncbi:MAG: HINT domain-containing protein [Silvanigrellaceae bacterium]|nr:HINT domain-containing protein [Silvanigrellaceae bacterium]